MKNSFKIIIQKWDFFSSIIFLSLTLFCLTPKAFAISFYRTGNPRNIQTITTPLTCLAGGGVDDYWADGWRKILEAAHGGDVLIIRGDGKRGGYESWIYNDDSSLNFPKVNSVETAILSGSEDGNNLELEKKIFNAEFIFFAGGDQFLYIDWLKNSRALAALNYALNIKRIPFAGTSAGMIFLSGISFTSRYNSSSEHARGSITSDDVINNPMAKFVDLVEGLLIAPYLQNVVTETHFDTRHRQGRWVGFMAKAIKNEKQNPPLNTNSTRIKGIAADEGAAFCYNADGIGHAYGNGRIYFAKPNSPIEQIILDLPLKWVGDKNAVDVQVLDPVNSESSFDLKSWTGTSVLDEKWWINGPGLYNSYFGDS